VMAVRYARFLRRERIDVVHLNNSVTRNNDWMLAALFRRTPCITHERGINAAFPPLARFFAPRLSAVICISAAVRDNMIRRGIPSRNLHVIHNGLDPAEMVPSGSVDQLRSAFDLGDHSPVIGVVSNIKEWKGQHVVVQALPAIKDAFPNVLCLFIGDTAQADRYYEIRLRTMVADLRLEDAVRFLGYQPNVADSLALLDAAILPSTDEPFGRVLLEAMAMRKPIVASRSGAVPEIVIDGVTGYTFSDGDSRELSECIVKLLRQPDTARSMGEKGFHRLVDEFHVRRNVARTLNLYESVVTKGSS
jgi:glycosyltransferase involved in cell wall biosynthesis